MSGQYAAPYRVPCGGYAAWTSRFFGHAQQNGDPAAVVPVYDNVTQVPTYLGSGPATIPPYPQPDPINVGGCGGANQPACGAWSVSAIVANVYSEKVPAETHSLSSCGKFGFKNVFGIKNWHGRYGFKDKDACCTGAKPAWQVDPSQVRYLRIDWLATASHYWGIDTSGGTGHFVWVDGEAPGAQQIISGYCLVDRFTGQKHFFRSSSNTLSAPTFAITDPVLQEILTGNVCYRGDLSPGVRAFNDVVDADLYEWTASPSGDALGIALWCNWYDFYGSTADALYGAAYSRTLADATVHILLDPHAIDPNVASFGGPTYELTLTLSTEYTGAELFDDWKAAVGQWDLTDDTKYPWRTDLRCTAGPLCTYDEQSPTAPAVDLSSGDDTGYSGALLGGPASVYGRTFDFRHTELHDLSGGSGICGDLRPFYYGQWSDDTRGDFAGTPFATQWTQLNDEKSLLPGAFLSLNGLINLGAPTCNQVYKAGSLVGAKYAETLLFAVRSHNFARPCGSKDLATRDQDTIDCTPDDADGFANEFGSRRWPDKPCFCNDTTQLGAAGVCGTATHPDMVNQWNDDLPKGDFLINAWSFDYRAAALAITENWTGFTQTPACLRFSACAPAAIYITSNGETDTKNGNSYTVDFPAFTVDHCYGSLWQAMPQQWMPDPLQQPAHRPCALDIAYAWTEDDGSGHNDDGTHHYYPQRQYEEARCTVPTGAPALPAGCYLGGLSVADINAAVAGNIVSPPTQGACWMAVWDWYAKRVANIAADGRFSCMYEDYTAICDTEDPRIVP